MSFLREKYGSRVENGRVGGGRFPSKQGDKFGRFRLTVFDRSLNILVGDGQGLQEMGYQAWDHISVSVEGKVDQKGRNPDLPTYPEMEEIRRLFFKPTALVVHYSMPRSDHINLGQVLHMWCFCEGHIPTPPKIAV